MGYLQRILGVLLLQCQVAFTQETAESLCGPKQINLTDTYLLNVTIRARRAQDCVWTVSASPGSITSIDVLNDVLTKGATFKVGRGRDSRNPSSVIHELKGNLRKSGTSLLVIDTNLWMRASWSKSLSLNGSFEVRVQSQNYSNEEAQCDTEQVLCFKNLMCLSKTLLCNGIVECTDYSDESDCDICGSKVIPLRRNESTTMLFQSHSGYLASSFVLYPGTSESMPNVTLCDVIEMHQSLLPQYCIWRLSEQPGTRIRIEVLQFEGHGVYLSIGNGTNPDDVPVLMLSTDPSKTIHTALPYKTFSIGSGVWIKLEIQILFSKLRLLFTPYDVVECDEDHPYACPTGLDCLQNETYVCDGRRECAANEDELGCGRCDPLYFECASGKCVPGHYVCDGFADCVDFMDEWMCGNCGNDTIYIRPDVRHFIEYTHEAGACIWFIIAESGSRIRAEFLKIPSCPITFLGGGDDLVNYSYDKDSIITQLNFTKQVYPSAITADASMWITFQCQLDSMSSPLVLEISQYNNIECLLPSEVLCASGLACVHETALCNGVADCPEHSDEIGCGYCNEFEFLCRSGQQCVSSQLICNGHSDCSDSSDEFECEPCGASFINVSNGTPGIIASPGWADQHYPDKALCFWLIVAEEGYRVVVTFNGVDLEEDYDFLNCGNGDAFSDPFLQLTGKRYPLSVASRENVMFLTFVSDSSTSSNGGFWLRVDQEKDTSVGCASNDVACDMEDLVCVKNDTSKNGRVVCSQDVCGIRGYPISYGGRTLTSPGYPNNYPPGIDCVWELRSDVGGYGIIVSILEFLTESIRDVVQIQGLSPILGLEIKFVLQGFTKLRSIVFNKKQPVVIRFTSDSTVTFSGFELKLHLHRPTANFNESLCQDDELFNCRDGSCVTIDAKCDGFRDCRVNGVDEHWCSDVQCPKSYRCADSSECIHWPLVCDGKSDCPFDDDESNLTCEKLCPPDCECDVDRGNLVVQCLHGWNTTTIAGIVKGTKLLNLSNANISVLETGLFKEFSFLKALYLVGNGIDSISPGTFSDLQNLTFLDISNNPISSIASNSFSDLHSLKTLVAKNVPLATIQTHGFDGLVHLQNLMLLRGGLPSDDPVDVRESALSDLKSLVALYVDDYRLCCEFLSAIDFNVTRCITTELQPPLSLCGSLMQNPLLRVSMWLLGLSALIGNIIVIVWRCRDSNERGGKKTYSFLVLNLAVSDFMMGVYMLILAVADVHFGEKYARQANAWRSSTVCKIAGVLSVVSSEASVFFVTIISLDCFFCIVFPFSQIKLRERSTKIIVSIMWFAAIGLSIGPTISVGSDDSDVYGLSDVCIGLPLITKSTGFSLQTSYIMNPLGDFDAISIPVAEGKEPAWIYSIVLFLGVNLLCFVIVFFCYIAIFVKVKRTASKVRVTAHRTREIKMAVKMALIVGTDFACWMPVIIMGILSQTGAVEIGSDIYAWIVVFILPINSSLNPYLYTLYTTISAQRNAKNLNTDMSKSVTTEMKTKSMETLNSTVSDNKPP